MNSMGKRRWRGMLDGKWHPVAFERRIVKATYARVELQLSRVDAPWRWTVYNRAATNYHVIKACGNETTVERAMEAAMKEYACRAQRFRLENAYRRLAQLKREAAA